MPDSEPHTNERSSVLQRYAAGGKPAQAALDGLTGVALRLFSASGAAVSLVDGDLHHIRSSSGFEADPGSELIRLIRRTAEGEDVLVSDDAGGEKTAAVKISNRGGVPFRLFAGAPLAASDGQPIGVLWLVREERAGLSEEEQGLLQELASAAAGELELIASDAARGGGVDPGVCRLEARRQAILEQTADVIAIVDRHMTIRYLQGAVEEVLGYTADELIGASTVNYIHPGDRSSVRSQFVKSLRRPGTTVEVELRFRHREAGWRFLSVRERCLLEVPEVRGFLCSARDVTAQKHRELALLEAKREAEEMSRLKSAFLRNMSHEIRTPLASIIGFSEVLAEELEGEEQEFAGLIYKGGRRLSETLHSVIDLARLESGQTEVERSAVRVTPLIREMVDLFLPRAREKGLMLKVDLPDPDLVIETDRPKMGHLLAHLLSNAIRFTRQGWVMVRAFAGAERVWIEVQDTGSGISETFRPRLFNEFERESSAMLRRHQGPGLGLAISRRLASMLGGEITVQSREGQGSTFKLSFPRPR